MDKISVIRTTRSKNGVVEKTKFYTELRPEERNNARKKKLAVNRAAKNTASSARTAGRILNNNFNPGDMLLTLTFEDEHMAKLANRADAMAKKILSSGEDLPDERDLLLLAARQEAENYIRRCQYALKNQEAEFKYFMVVSDMDGKSQDPERPHVHIVVNAEVAEVCKKKWGYGFNYERSLYSWCPKRATDYSELAAYLVRQSRVIGEEKRYTPSRNLSTPDASDRIATKPEAILRAPSGSILLEQGAYVPGLPQYIRYFIPPKNDEDKDHEHKKLCSDKGGYK